MLVGSKVAARGGHVVRVKRTKFVPWAIIRRISNDLEVLDMAIERGHKGPLKNWSDEHWCVSATGSSIEFHRYDNSKIRYK